MHQDNLFLTLTYAPEHEPADRSVSPRELQLFLKRLRRNVEPTRFRYFGVGEYGDKTQRPHYHLAIFGLGFQHEKAIHDAWPYGFIYLGDITSGSSSYVAGYVTKKMTKQKDFPDGRHPEFARMSLRPGIGLPAMEKVLDAITSPTGGGLPDGDVPRVLRHGGKIYPLGRYLRTKLREMYGFTEEAKHGLVQKAKQDLQDMLLAFFTLTPPEKLDFFKRKSKQYLRMKPIEYAWQNDQQERNLKAKQKLYQRKL